MTSRRLQRSLTVKVSCEAHEAWHHFAETNGVSLAALLEVVGPRLLSQNLTATVDETLKDLSKQARAIDTQRRTRRRRT